MDSIWGRCVALVDMVSFFASVEQLDYPHLAGRPIAVVNGNHGSTIIASSYQARAYGIKTGTHLKKAQQVCPQLVVQPTRPKRYTQVSTLIMSALETITNQYEVFSIDECFLDLANIIHLYPSIEALAEHIRNTVYQASGGLNCSIGISEGKITAKYCAKLRKGLTTLIPAHLIAKQLSAEPLTVICGINKGIEQHLKNFKVFHCGDLNNYPITILSQRFGSIGRRLYLTCLGHDPQPLQLTLPQPKQVGHSKILPPNTTNATFIWATLVRQCEKVAARLRRSKLKAKRLLVTCRSRIQPIQHTTHFSAPTDSSNELIQVAKLLFSQWAGQGIDQVCVLSSELTPTQVTQLDLFAQELHTSSSIDQLKDQINQRFGSKTLISGSSLPAIDQIDVIAPSWQPKGVRQSLSDHTLEK